MYESPSKQQPNQVYVFDEFKLSGDLIGAHPRLQHHGKVIETLDVSLAIPPTDIQLIDILRDCDRYPVSMFVQNGSYDNVISYIKSILSGDELERNDDTVSVHKVDTSN